jgi:hypothetical protein
MNDNLLAVELAAVLAADSGLAALIPYIYAEQAGALTQRPSLSLKGSFTPFGIRRKGELVLELRSRIADEVDADGAPVSGNHVEQFTALWNLLLGAQASTNAAWLANAAAAKAAIKTAIAARQKVEIVEYGPATDAL